jgi:hypothetical protein
MLQRVNGRVADQETPLMAGDVEDLKVELAGLRGVIETEMKHVGHDLRAMKLTMDSLVTRREIETIHEQQAQHRAEFDRRVQSIESTLSWAMRLIVTAWIAGLGMAVTLIRGH